MNILLEVKKISQAYSFKKQVKTVLNEITFTLPKGTTLGLVGESGSGKSTLAELICLLQKPVSGEIYFESLNIHKATSEQKKTFRKEVQLVFQDPYSSLNPRFKALDSVMEAFLIHKLASKKEAEGLARKLLLKMGIASEHQDKFPHELSGGQRQRICIARSLAVGPKLLVLDEPLSSLDVSVQIQMVELLKHIQKESELTYLFISHDLSMVRYFCTQALVLYRGSVLEAGTIQELFENPRHPYTQFLMDSIPVLDPVLERKRPPLTVLAEKEVVSKGCPFAFRCPRKKEECEEKMPSWKQVSKTHRFACFNPKESSS